MIAKAESQRNCTIWRYILCMQHCALFVHYLCDRATVAKWLTQSDEHRVHQWGDFKIVLHCRGNRQNPNLVEPTIAQGGHPISFTDTKYSIDLVRWYNWLLDTKYSSDIGIKYSRNFGPQVFQWLWTGQVERGNGGGVTAAREKEGNCGPVDCRQHRRQEHGIQATTPPVRLDAKRLGKLDVQTRRPEDERRKGPVCHHVNEGPFTIKHINLTTLAIKWNNQSGALTTPNAWCDKP